MTSTSTFERLPGSAPDPWPAGYDLADRGYLDEEYVFRGTAESYRWRDEHGRVAEADQRAPFTTRLIVRRPADPAKFSGTVVVEWLNVSNGMDFAPDWRLLQRHLVRAGHAWVGVSAQRAGIEGGGLVEGPHLKRFAPERYAMLSHPGDAYSFDIFSQAGRLLRLQGNDLLGAGGARQLLAVGDSQSAMILVTYVNAVDPLAGVFDGFLIHGRPAVAADLRDPAIAESTVEAEGVGSAMSDLAARTSPEPIRDDVRVPVLMLQSETDVAVAQAGQLVQPDTDRIRVWEIAGAAHGDTYLVASLSDDGGSPERLAHQLRPVCEALGTPTAAPINSGPQQHYVGQAALEHLRRWADGGTPPPSAPRLPLTDAGDDIRRDDSGIALGGLRTPWVDVPAAVLSGMGQGGFGFGFLFGTTRPLGSAELSARYPNGRGDYLGRFTDSLDAAIAAGFIVPDDRDEILAVAAADSPV